MEPVVDDPRDLTADWVSGALRAAGHSLTAVEVIAEEIGNGQTGTTLRLALSYDGPPGPPTLVAKMSGPDPQMRRRVAAGYAAEVGFYQHLAPGLEIRTPKCWYSAITDDRSRFTLLLDDLAPARPGSQTDGCEIPRAEACVTNLIGLHAPLWCDPSLQDMAFLLRTDTARAEMLGDMTVSAAEGFIDRYSADLDPEHVSTLRAAAEATETWLQASPTPFSVLHGDYRLDNLLFGRSCDDVSVVDWQTAAVGPPMRDVAYFLGTSLDPGQRRNHEERLVAGYHAALCRGRPVRYPADGCWDDYRLGQLQGPMVTILGCMYSGAQRSAYADAMFVTMARRSSSAIMDLRSLDLL